jgi:hypothetical protein
MNLLRCGAKLWFCLEGSVDSSGHRAGHRIDGSAVEILAFGILDDVKVHLYFGWSFLRFWIARQVDHFDLITGTESDRHVGRHRFPVHVRSRDFEGE